MGGGFHPNNKATSWPNLQAEAEARFQLKLKCKLGPSVAKIQHCHGSPAAGKGKLGIKEGTQGGETEAHKGGRTNAQR